MTLLDQPIGHADLDGTGRTRGGLSRLLMSVPTSSRTLRKSNRNTRPSSGRKLPEMDRRAHLPVGTRTIKSHRALIQGGPRGRRALWSTSRNPGASRGSQPTRVSETFRCILVVAVPPSRLDIPFLDASRTVSVPSTGWRDFVSLAD